MCAQGSMQGGRGLSEILGLMKGLQSPVSPSESFIKQGLHFIFMLHTKGKDAYSLEGKL